MTSTQQQLQALFNDCYQLRGWDDEAAGMFQQHVEGLLGMEDAAMEGLGTGEGQRDQAVRFAWGHQHDFGRFKLEGAMGDRHVRLLGNFVDHLALPMDLTGARVLDIGCWTGGTSLMLAAMGAEVQAVEEVRKYAETAQWLANAFEANVKVHWASAYDLPNIPTMAESFDHVFALGVLYHVTDPLLFLRLLFDATCNGGALWVETEADPAPQPYWRYEGPNVFRGGDATSRTRRGWNWLIPTRAALAAALRDCGFASVEAGPYVGSRAVAVATRQEHRPFMLAGVSDAQKVATT